MAHIPGAEPDVTRPQPTRPPAPPPAWDNPLLWLESAAASGTIVVAPCQVPAGAAGRAAQYIRMSTEHQRYSPANQGEAIARYAQGHGLEVVRTYLDEGRSGLSVQGRAGLAALLGDVVGGRADFAVVLVYDVSRWGRFQDTDEAAYYEYLCRRSGIRVEYCMEPFRNDGSPMSAIVKGLKRVMAAEYSRELSEKVFLAKCHIARLGYFQGRTGYGLRRLVVDANGRPRGVLQEGEHKLARSDRSLLVAGPKEELAVVRWLFRRVADHGGRPTELARDLNGRGVLSNGGEPWNADRVQRLVTNEKYIGNLIFNRTSMKMKGPKVNNPPELWIRKERAMTPIVTPALFRRAQEAMGGWSTRVGTAAALERLRELLARHGKLSARLINGTPGMPGSVFYEDHFGGLLRAYALVGYRPRRDCSYIDGHNVRLRRLAALRAQVPALLSGRGVPSRAESRSVLVVGEQLRVAVMLARCRMVGQTPRWLVQPHIRPTPDWLLIERLDEANAAAMDYWLVAGGSQYAQLGAPHRSRRERHRAADLDGVVDLLVARARAEA